MTDISSVSKKLIDPGQIDPNYIKKIGKEIGEDVRTKRLKIIDLVKGIDPVLTSGSHQIRLRGVEILELVITSLGREDLSKKEVEVLTEFLCLRLLDHKSMEKPVLTCFLRFVDYADDLVGPAYNKTLLDFFKTKLNVRKLEGKNRFVVYEILKKIIILRRSKSSSLDSDLLYSLIHLIEGENNPENLLLCFSIVSYVLKNFQDLEPFIDDLFEWLSSYYPIDYAPSEGPEGVNIVKSDLVNALYDCFYATELNVDNLQTLLLEKLDSNLMSTKLESLNCLIKSYELSNVMTIRPYASSLWTFVRVECLRKVNLVDPHLLALCYKALNALTEKLSDDEETFFTFIRDMYEELAIAFKKPEMDLFEPASRLLTNAILPKLSAFNYVLQNILPISLNALKANELKPLPGLAYIFQKLHEHHPNSTLGRELDDTMNKLVIEATKTVGKDSLELLRAALLCKIRFTSNTQQVVIDKLSDEVKDQSLDIEGCLALFCSSYKRLDIIFGDGEHNCELSYLLKQIQLFRPIDRKPSDQGATKTKAQLSIYLRLLILLLHETESSTIDEIGSIDLIDFIEALRSVVVEMEDEKVVENIGRLHAIVLNKLGESSIQPVIMSFIGSKFCQDLTPAQGADQTLSQRVYLPVVRWTLKSLVVRNHPLATPMINLVLNFMTSDRVDKKLAVLASQVPSFIYSEDNLCTFDKDCHYHIFSLFKQKFYMLTVREIKIRIASEQENFKKCLLATSVANQIPHLPPAVYRKDFEWLIREILKVLGSLKKSSDDIEANEELTVVLLDCTESLLSNECSDNILGLLGSLVDLFIEHTKFDNTIRVRKGALNCLAKIATSFNHSELLILRSSVINKLKPSLADKKRLVRQAAAEARLRWVLVGQPIGS